MNVVDGEKLKDTLVDPALSRLEGVTLPALEQAAQRVVALAADRLAAVGAGALEHAGEVLAHVLAQADGDLSRLLAGLDGWTLQISVRLTAPQGLTPSKGIE